MKEKSGQSEKEREIFNVKKTNEPSKDWSAYTVSMKSENFEPLGTGTQRVFHLILTLKLMWTPKIPAYL